MHRLLKTAIFLFPIILIIVCPLNVHAQEPIFDPEYIISNHDLTNYQAMTMDKIQNFLIEKEHGEISKLSKDWIINLEELKKSYQKEGLIKKEELIKTFSKHTINGFYFLSLAVFAGKKLINYLLKDEIPKKHIIELESESYNEIKSKIRPYRWLNILKKKRPTRPFSNTIDSLAISIVMQLNEEAFNNKKSEIYFLLSDAEIFRKILIENKNENDLVDYPIVRKDLIEGGFNILRSSFHFEELLLAFYKSNHSSIKYIKESNNSIDAQIACLTNRKLWLVNNIYNMPPQLIDRITITCKKAEKCPCKIEKECVTLSNKLKRFFDNEEKNTNLSNILSKDSTFEPLLKFISKYFDAVISNIDLSNLKKFEKIYTKFFFEEYEPGLVKDLENTLCKFKEQMSNTISSLIKDASLKKQIVLNLYMNLRKIEGVNYLNIFSKHEELKDIFKDFSNLSTIISQNKNILKNWYNKLFNVLMSETYDPGKVLLQIIVLFCYREYEMSRSIAINFIEEKESLIKESGLLEEFYYMYYISKTRILFKKVFKYNEKKNEYIKKIDEIVKCVKTKVSSSSGDNPRFLYLISKIYANQIFFNIRKNDYILEQAIEYAFKAKEQDNDNFDFLKIPIDNIILWCFTKKRSLSEKEMIKLEELFNEIKKCNNKANYSETISSYYYFKSKKIFDSTTKGESKKYFETALNYLDESIKLSEREGYREMDLEMVSLGKQYRNWTKEFNEKFLVNSIE